MTDYLIHPLPGDALSAARNAPAGPLHERLAAAGGEPLRCCLRDAEEGSALILVNYEPPLPASPYRERGGVFVHADECAGPASTTAYPVEWSSRPQVLRAYDKHGWIHEATTTHDGTDPEAAIAEVLAHPEVVRVHSRNIAYGCYMFAITRR